MTNVRRHAELIANSEPAHGYGFAIATTLILTVLEYAIPAIIKCYLSNHAVGASPEDNAAHLKDIAEKAYHVHRGVGRYSPQILRLMRESVRDGVKSTGDDGEVTDEQCDAISARTLDHARGLGVEEIQQMVSEVCPVLATIKIYPAV
jgi:hypothetical protein